MVFEVELELEPDPDRYPAELSDWLDGVDTMSSPRESAAIFFASKAKVKTERRDRFRTFWKEIEPYLVEAKALKA